MGRRRIDENTIPIPGIGDDIVNYGQIIVPTKGEEVDAEDVQKAEAIEIDVDDLDAIFGSSDDEEITLERPVLRVYQDDAQISVLKTFSSENPERSDICAVVMPTGTGKTITFCSLAELVTVSYGKRVLVVCHQIDTVGQWINDLKLYGLRGLREQGSNRAVDKMAQQTQFVVVACEASLSQERLAECWPRDFFDFVIHDECDLSFSPRWSNIIEWFNKARHVGITATPKIGKKKTILSKYKVLAYQYPITEAVKKGHLVRVIDKRIKNKVIDLTQIRVSTKDFVLEDLSDVIGKNISAIAEASLPYMKGKPTIAFTPTVFTAQALAECFRQFGVKAIAISADTKSAERRRIYDALATGEYECVCNCRITTRGVDIPCAEVAIMANPTCNESFFIQMVGRILRPYKNKQTGYVKKHATIVNFAWKFQDKAHRLACATDIFAVDKDVDEDVKEEAALIYEKKRNENPELDIDPQQLIEQAKKNIDAKIKKDIKFKLQNLTYQTTSIDLLALEILEVPHNPSINFMGGKKPTDGMIKALEKFGIDKEDIEEFDYLMASRLIGELKSRADKGLASWKQVKTLIKCNVPWNEANQFSFEEASAYLDANLSSQPWFKPNRSSVITKYGNWSQKAE